MYRISVSTSGKYGNVATGNRYCFFKKTAIDLANCFMELEAWPKIEKLVYAGDCFFWSEETGIVPEENEKGDLFLRALTRKERREEFE